MFYLRRELFEDNFEESTSAPMEARKTTGSPSSLNEPHKEHNMASNYKGLYGIFYKVSMKVAKSGNVQ